MIITFHLLDVPGGGTLVLGPDHRVSIAAAEYRDLADSLEERIGSSDDQGRDMATAKDARSKADEIERLYAQAKAAGTREESVEIRPFTKGEQIEAKRIATTYKGETAIVDHERYTLELLKKTTGKHEKDLLEMAPNLYDAIAREVFALSMPQPERLTFLSSARHGSATMEH